MQWAVVAVMFGLNALDGFDALAISFAAPGILAQWGLTRAALGVVMSLELVGMTLGILSCRRSFPKDPMRFIPAQAEAERVGSGSGYR